MAATIDCNELQPPSDHFPTYTDGDVLVMLSPSRQYRLHSRTLRLHSSFFKRLLNEENAAQLSSRARREIFKTCYRVELDLPLKGQSGVGNLLLRQLDDRGRAVGSCGFLDVEQGKVAPEIYQHYDNLFRAYYYQPVILDDTNISHVLRDIVGLIEVAEYLGSMKVVSLCIDNALIKQGQVLFRSISANAAVWADLAFRVQSELVFKEAIIHMVGQWANLKARDDIRDEIRALCQRKHIELDEMKRAIELRIMGHYPLHIQRPINSNTGPGSVTTRGRGNSTRATSYASDIFAWMAMNLFRHWLGQHMCGDLNRHAPDGGYTFYHALHAAGDAYIDRGSVESFTQYFPLSAKGRSALEEQIALLKEGVKPYVSRLVEHRGMLDVARFPVAYLTCVDVTKGDLPWMRSRTLPMPLGSSSHEWVRDVGTDDEDHGGSATDGDIDVPDADGELDEDFLAMGNGHGTNSQWPDGRGSGGRSVDRDDGARCRVTQQAAVDRWED